MTQHPISEAVSKYREAQAVSKEASLIIKQYLTPVLTAKEYGLIPIFYALAAQYYEEPALTSDHRDDWIVLLLWLYSPASLLEKRPTPKGFNREVAKLFDVSSQQVSNIVRAVRGQYLAFPSIQERFAPLYGYVVKRIGRPI